MSMPQREPAIGALTLLAPRSAGVCTRILVAVSGGPDSVALAHFLKTASYSLVLGHVNHQLRKQSARDADFVGQLAKEWNLPYKKARVDVKRLVKSSGMSIEEAARELRYQCLEQMAKQTQCHYIATGHTADDQAETVFMNWLRGAGPSGLAGMPLERPLSHGITLWRPFLQNKRAQIMDYLRVHELPFRRDPSNRQVRYTRNRIRLKTLPELEKAWPGLGRRLGQAARIFQEEEDFWQNRVSEAIPRVFRRKGQKGLIDLAGLFGYHSALGRRILRHLLGPIPFLDLERVWSFAHTTDLKKKVILTNGVKITRSVTQLVIKKQRIS